MEAKCHTCGVIRADHGACLVLASLRRSWPHPMMVSQLMGQCAMTAAQVEGSVEDLRCRGEDIVRTVDQSGIPTLTSMQLRWRQSILTSQPAVAPRTADPASSSPPLPGPTTRSAGCTRYSTPAGPVGPTSAT
jgi:hypothetical protein